MKKNEYPTNEEIDNIINNVEEKLNDLPKEENNRESDDQENEWRKCNQSLSFTNQYLLSKEQFNKLSNKINELSKNCEKIISDKLNKKIEFGIPEIHRGTTYNDLLRQIIFCYSDTYIKSWEINNESFIISCDPSLVNSVLMHSNDDNKATVLKKSIADEFIINPILELLNKEALNKDFTKQTTFDELCHHDSLYSWVIIEQKVSYKEEKGSILIAAPENTWQLFLNEKSLPTNNEEYVNFNENTSYALIASTSIRHEDISKMKPGDKIYFDNKDYTSGIAIYKNKEVIRDNLLLRAFNFGTFGVSIDLLGLEEKIEIGKDNLLVIIGEKERSEEEINKIKEREYISLETDLSQKLTLLYNYKPVAKGIFAERHGQSCFTVDSIRTNKEGE